MSPCPIRRAGLSILGAYTWSKSLSNADTSSVGGGTYLGGLQDYNDLRGNRATSAFDVPHRLSVAGIYDVPLRGLMLGGWQIGAIVTEQTGFAAALAGGVDTTSTGVVSRTNA